MEDIFNFMIEDCKKFKILKKHWVKSFMGISFVATNEYRSKINYDRCKDIFKILIKEKKNLYYKNLNKEKYKRTIIYYDKNYFCSIKKKSINNYIVVINILNVKNIESFDIFRKSYLEKKKILNSIKLEDNKEIKKRRL